jgi:hypothetical protein
MEMTMTHNAFGSGHSTVPSVDVLLDIEAECAFAQSDYPPLYETKQEPPMVRTNLERERQVLSYHFPELAHATYDVQLVEAVERGRICLSARAERLMLVPRWQHYFGSDYWAATKKVLTVLREKYLVWAVQEDDFSQVSQDSLHQSERSRLLYEELGRRQVGHNLLVVPVQMGRRFAGHSVRSVQQFLHKNHNEAGLGILEIVLFLMSHPDRIVPDYNALWIDCPGSIVHQGERTNEAFTLRFNEKRLQVRVASLLEADGRSGAATFFLL